MEGRGVKKAGADNWGQNKVAAKGIVGRRLDWCGLQDQGHPRQWKHLQSASAKVPPNIASGAVDPLVARSDLESLTL